MRRIRLKARSALSRSTAASPRGRKVLLFFIGYDFLFPLIYIFRQALRGAGDTRYFLKVSLFVDVLYFLPGIFLAVRFFGVDYVVLWSFFLSYLLILSVVFTRRFRGGLWKHYDREHLQEQA